jgi:hypothetical protein
MNYREFMSCELKKIKAEHPTMKQTEIMKTAAAKWGKHKGKKSASKKGPVMAEEVKVKRTYKPRASKVKAEEIK